MLLFSKKIFVSPTNIKGVRCGTHCVKMTQVTWPPYPASCSMRRSQIFKKIDSFPKNVLNIFSNKKGRFTYLKNSSLIYIYLFSQSAFPLLSWIPEKIQPSWRNDLIRSTNWGGKQHRKCTDFTWFPYQQLQ